MWLFSKTLQMWLLLMQGTPFSRELFWALLSNKGMEVYSLCHRCQRRKCFWQLAYSLRIFKGQRKSKPPHYP